MQVSSITKVCRIVGIVALIMLLTTELAMAQQKLPAARLSPKLAQKMKVLADDLKISVILTCKTSVIPAELRNVISDLQQLNVTGNNFFFKATLPVHVLRLVGKKFPEIVFIEDGARKPKEELLIANLDKSVNAINMVHSNFPQGNGNGITLSVKEDRPDTADIDFKGRFLSTNLSSEILSSHATIMATMAAGGGNSWHLGKGVAWAATISSSDFSTLLPDDSSSYRQYNISLQNHSYGVGIENYYGADAAAYDASATGNPSLLHIFSAGNEGLSASDAGIYTGITGFANLTGSFKMAKNVLTVAATDSFKHVSALSSRGPAYDGRVKPDLVAFGEDGSSGAAALVSGVAMVLQQLYKDKHGELPSGALVRAILINSTDKAGNIELDYATGFGNLNALKAARTLIAGRYLSGNLTGGESHDYVIVVPAGLKKLKITVAWNDPPAEPGAPKALVNDLDMELVSSSTGERWQPWVLNSFPHADSLSQLPVRKRDTLNNIEQVTLDDPSPGQYVIKVTGLSVSSAHQDFHIAYEFDSSNIFEWGFPGRDDFLFTTSINTLRWYSSYSAGTGLLEYSTNNGDTWNLVSNSVPLADGYYQWPSTGITGEVLLRMTIDGKQFTTDTVTVSQRTQTGVGYDCTDSFLIYWDKLPRVNTYKVYALGPKYLEPQIVTSNDFVVIAKNKSPSVYYAVSPLIGNGEGVKSYAFNYTTQGVGCYIRTFFALLNENSVHLQLSLGTTYGLIRIILEKSDGRDFLPLQEITTINGLEFEFTDLQLRNGVNTYRIRLVLADGKIVYSSPETIYYFPKSSFTVYPNPVRQTQSLTILAEETGAVLQVINGLGQIVGKYTINETNTVIPAGRFGKGLYFFRFIKDNAIKQAMKIIVQ